MSPSSRLFAAVATATLALTACTTAPAPESVPPAELVEQRLTELSVEADAFSRLDVGDDELSAWAVQNGQLRHWRLNDGLGAARDVEQRYPAVEFSSLDLAELEKRVRSLTDQCDAAHHRVTVEALTPSAQVTELRCGDEDFAELGNADPVAVMLGPEPLVDYTQLSVEGAWTQALGQAEVLDPALTLTSLVIDADEVVFGTSVATATNDCRPTVHIAKDGSDLSWRCAPVANEPPLGLDRLTASELASLQAGAMRDAGIVDPAEAQVTIGTDPDGVARMHVRHGTRSAEVSLF